jgi:DNA invertase Pin-like site-specific DNA recombinase
LPAAESQNRRRDRPALAGEIEEVAVVGWHRQRSMIRERVNAGIARAKAAGKHCGRPFIDTKLEGHIRQALAAPDRPGLHKIAKQFGVATGTVQRIAAEA